MSNVSAMIYVMDNDDNSVGLADGLAELLASPGSAVGAMMRCDQILASLTGEDRKLFSEVIQTSSISGERISTAMRSKGIVVAASSVRAWRRANGVTA